MNTHEECGTAIVEIGAHRRYCPKCRRIIESDMIARSGNIRHGTCRRCGKDTDIATAVIARIGDTEKWIAVCLSCGEESWGYAETEEEAVRRVVIVPRNVRVVV